MERICGDDVEGRIWDLCVARAGQWRRHGHACGLEKQTGAATVPSPLFYRGRLYLVQDGGRVTCYRAKTGEALYEQKRLDAEGQYWASPIAADAKVYFASTRGNIAVIEAADHLKVLARNK